jgi:2'-5' RNA ligase
MRLFIAVNFSDEVKNRIVNIQEQLRAQTVTGNFTRPGNFHLTLAFLGETPEEKLKPLFRIMEEIHAPPFDISFSSAGCFSHSRKELWWIGAEPDCPGLGLLKAIHQQLIDRLDKEVDFQGKSFSVDKRPFNAHITLGREIKHFGPIALDKPCITVRVDRISLMKSEHVKGVLTYTELFAREPAVPAIDLL